MFTYDQMAQEVGLKEPKKEVQKKASPVELNPVIEQIDAWLASDKLSTHIEEFEKKAEIEVSEELKSYVKTAEEQGLDEKEIVDNVFQKYSYKLPEITEEERVEKDLLIKASAEITRLEKVATKLMDQVDMMKFAMDLVESNQIAPYKSFNDLVEQTAELTKSASIDTLKEAVKLRVSELPGIGKAASGPSSKVKQTPEDRLLERLQNAKSSND